MRTALGRPALLGALGVWAVAGCATVGTRPQDMSVAGHEAAAASATAEAAKVARSQIQPPPTAASANAIWRTEDSRHWLAVAEKHRAAAQALREAEALACVGIEESDREPGPFFRPEDIAGVTRLEERTGKNGSKLVGAAIEVRAAPGLTAEWLQRRMECHVARSAVVGRDDPKMKLCPLAVKGVSTRVRSRGDRFLAEVRADSSSGAEEVCRRARALWGAC